MAREYLSTQQAADYLGVSLKTIAKWRVQGVGPAYRKIGRIIKYLVNDLDGWADSRLRKSTSDPGPGQAA